MLSLEICLSAEINIAATPPLFVLILDSAVSTENDDFWRGWNTANAFFASLSLKGNGLTII